MKDENDEEFDVEKLSTISFPKPHIVSKPKIWYKKIGNLRSGVGHVYNWGALKESIEKHGIIEPIVLAKFHNTVEDGNHRLAMAKLLYSADTEVPCVYADELYYQNPKTRREWINGCGGEYRFPIPNPPPS